MKSNGESTAMRMKGLAQDFTLPALQSITDDSSKQSQPPAREMLPRNEPVFVRGALSLGVMVFIRRIFGGLGCDKGPVQPNKTKLQTCSNIVHDCLSLCTYNKVPWYELLFGNIRHITDKRRSTKALEISRDLHVRPKFRPIDALPHYFGIASLPASFAAVFANVE